MTDTSCWYPSIKVWSKVIKDNFALLSRQADVIISLIRSEYSKKLFSVYILFLNLVLSFLTLILFFCKGIYKYLGKLIWLWFYEKSQKTNGWYCISITVVAAHGAPQWPQRAAYRGRVPDPWELLPRRSPTPHSRPHRRRQKLSAQAITMLQNLLAT